MANTYYVFAPTFIPGQKVRSDEVNTQYSAIEAAFDLMPTDNSAILRGTTFLGVDSGTANAIEITLTDPRTSYQDGDQISWKATNTNTGASTIDIDSVGAVTIVNSDGSALAAGDVAAGLYYTAIFDSTNNRWQMLGASAAALAAADDRVTWASEWATQPEDTLVSVAAGGDGASDYSALHWAAKASASAGAASTSETNAGTSETNAAASEAAAAASAAGVNLPAIGGGDASKLLKVNAGETGYEFLAQGTGGGLDADTVDGNEASALLARANHTGTQTMSTISDAGSLATQNTVDNADWSGTDLSVANGGTGVSFLPNNNVLLGAGTSISGAVPGVQGRPLISTGGVTDPEFGDYIRPDHLAFYGQHYGDVYTSPLALPWDTVNYISITLDQNTTFSFNTPWGDSKYTLKTLQGFSGPYTVTWPSGIRWVGSTAAAPTARANATDIFTFFYNSNDNIWYGMAAHDFG